jgi:hypothetical protein
LEPDLVEQQELPEQQVIQDQLGQLDLLVLVQQVQLVLQDLLDQTE